MTPTNDTDENSLTEQQYLIFTHAQVRLLCILAPLPNLPQTQKATNVKTNSLPTILFCSDYSDNTFH